MPQQITAAVFILLGLLVGCSSTPPLAKKNIQEIPAILPVEEQQTPTDISLLSPYSTEGLQALDSLRMQDKNLDAFLSRNRKPDYFFAMPGNKTFLIYQQSENLYRFDPGSTYKKFHPLPASVKQNLDQMLALQREQPTQIHNAPDTVEESYMAQLADMSSIQTIEKNLADRNPQPYLDGEIIRAIPLATDGMVADNRLYLKTYYLDKSLDESLENEYSAKYDAKKQSLKIIFPLPFDANTVYKNPGADMRKIYLERNTRTGVETALIVPDFLPGSTYYKTTRGNMLRAFSALYQIKVAQDFVSSDRLRIRYAIKLCQNDGAPFCASSKGKQTNIRAIVIAATLYDSATKTILETFVLK